MDASMQIKLKIYLLRAATSANLCKAFATQSAASSVHQIEYLIFFK